MRFSIIVPVYNAEAFVGDTIDNLLRQDVDKEIILVNDGSTDNSLQLLRNYELHNDCIRVIDKPNGGVSTARNAGLDAATGDYILFVDSDDFIDKSLLKRCEEIMFESNPDVVVFSYKYTFPKEPKRKDIPFFYKETGRYLLKDWLDDFLTLNSLHIMNCIGTKLYKRTIIEEHSYRFNEQTSYYEDVGFCTGYFAFVNSLYYINEPLYHYRIINQNSLITAYRPRFSHSIAYLRQQQKKMFEKAFGKENYPHALMIRLWENDIVECLANIFYHKSVPNDEMERELKHLSENQFLSECYEQAHSFSSKICLRILKLENVSRMISLFKAYYAVSVPYDRYIGNNLRRIVRKYRSLCIGDKMS